MEQVFNIDQTALLQKPHALCERFRHSKNSTEQH